MEFLVSCAVFSATQWRFGELCSFRSCLVRLNGAVRKLPVVQVKRLDFAMVLFHQ